MSTPSSSPNRNRNLAALLAGVALLALCLCVLGGVGLGGYYFYLQRQPGVTAIGPAVEYILDASPRMAGTFEGSTRLELARGVLAEVVRPAGASVAAGLRAFGSGAVTTACQDTDLLVPLGPANQARIADSALTLDAGANSDSALAAAMLAAIRDLAAAEGPHSLVVITGGADSCNAQAGDLIKQEAGRAGIKLQEFVVGFGLDPAESQAVKGMVVASGGTYLEAPDTDTLRNIVLAIQNHIDQPSSTSLATIQTAATPGAVLSLSTAAAPGATPDPGATAEPGATAPSAAATQSAGLSGQTACDHPFMPLRPGSTWTYSSSAGPQTWTVQSVTGDQNSATAHVVIDFSDVQITYNWQCDSEGIRFYQGMGITGGVIAADLKISDESGVALLAADKLVPGASWTYAYTMTIVIEGNTVTDHVTADRTAGAVQSATNELGTFDTITVTGTENISMTTSFGSVPDVNSTETWQLGRGVGIMQMDSSSGGSSDSTVLTSYHIP